MTNETKLAELLVQWDDAQATGTDFSVEQLCKSCPELVPEFRQLLAKLELLPTSTRASAETLPRADESVEGLDAGRYRPIRYHARGGLGIVYVAEDGELHREVAIKFMQNKQAIDGASRQRFLEEGRITGWLEHPGVVPIHGLGIDPAGNPYYAMRFIHGEGMDKSIQNYFQSTDDRNVGFRKLLRHFLSVCETMAYAHSRGVIHRDLKPSNIMIGPYGETLVLDWGLAKLVGATETDDGSALPLTAENVAASVTGLAKGSPPYMSPEQARGEWKQVGPASDIYSLGATLYVLLTGKKPYEGASARAVMEAASRGSFSLPRQVNPSISHSLEAICLKAMQHRPEDRYAGAGELAADLERWLADEPVSVIREPAWDRLRRWGRKHRPLVAGGSALLVTAVLGLALGLFFVNNERSNTQQALERVTEEEGKARKALEAESIALEKSQRSEKAATHQRQLALRTMQRVVAKVDGRLKGKPALQDLRKELLNEVGDGLKEVARAADTADLIDHETIVVYFEIGDILIDLEGATKEAESVFNKAHKIAVQLELESKSDLGAHDLAASFERKGDALLKLGNAPAALSDFDESARINRVLETKHRETPESAEYRLYRHNLITALWKSSQTLLKLGNNDLAFERLNEARVHTKNFATDEAESAKGQHIRTLIDNSLGLLSLERGDIDTARVLFQDALAVREKLHAEQPNEPDRRRDLSISFDRMGEIAYRSNDLKGAESFYRRALDLRQAVANLDPANVFWQRDLMVSHELLGKVNKQRGAQKAAIESYQQCVNLGRKLAAIDTANLDAKGDFLVSLLRLGDGLREFGDIKQAFLAYTESLGLAEELATAAPVNVDWQRQLAEARTNLAKVHLSRGEPKLALELVGKAIAIEQSLLEKNPSRPRNLQNLASVLHVRGNAHLRLNDRQAALTDLKEAVTHAEKGVALDAKDLSTRRELSAALKQLAFFYEQTGESAESLKFVVRHVEIDRGIAKDDPVNAIAQSEHLRGLYRQAEMQRTLSDFKGAQLTNKEALDWLNRLPPVEDAAPKLRRQWIMTLAMKGDLAFAANDPNEALKAYEETLRINRRAVEQAKDDRDLQVDFGISASRVAKTLIALGRPEDAIKLADEAVAVDRALAIRFPNEPEIFGGAVASLYQAAIARERALQIENARKSYREALDILEALDRRKMVLDPRRHKVQSDALTQRIAFCDGVVAVGKDLTALEKQPETSHSRILAYLLDVYLDRKDHAGLQPIAERYAKIGTPVVLYVAGYATARCISLTEDAALREKYANSAMKYLEKAVAGGYKAIEKIKADPAFQPLRNRKDYIALLERAARQDGK